MAGVGVIGCFQGQSLLLPVEVELFAGLDATAVQQLHAQLGQLRVHLVRNDQRAEDSPS